MVLTCCVPGCGSTASLKDGVSLHKFTTNDELKKQWISLISCNTVASKRNQHSFTVTKLTKICSKHFIEDDMHIGSERSRLKLNAVPTLFPRTSGGSLEIKIISATNVQTENGESEISVSSDVSTSVGIRDSSENVNCQTNVGFIEVKLEQGEVVIKHELEETNSAGVEDCILNTETSCNNSRPFEIKLEQEELFIKDEVDKNDEIVELQEGVGEEASGTFKCKICRQWIPLNSLENHMLSHKKKNGSEKTNKLIPKAEKPFKCSQCQKCFAHSSFLQRHLLIYGCIGSLECKLCDKTFIQRATLEAHMLIHEGLKPFKCEHCNKDFRTISALRAHLLTHKTERCFKCNLCDKAFTTSSYLQQHLISHEDKRFKCDQCQKVFRLSSHLKQHFLMHAGDKPFQCQLCHKRFLYNRSLGNHVLKNDH